MLLRALLQPLTCSSSWASGQLSSSVKVAQPSDLFSIVGPAPTQPQGMTCTGDFPLLP